jgi:hypothetical protein
VVSALRLAPEQSGEVDRPAPAERWRRDESRLVRIPQPRLRSLPGRPTPVVGSAEKRASATSVDRMAPHQRSGLGEASNGTGTVGAIPRIVVKRRATVPTDSTEVLHRLERLYLGSRSEGRCERVRGGACRRGGGMVWVGVARIGGGSSGRYDGSVSFFDPPVPEPEREPWPRYQRRDWHGPPENVLGMPAAVRVVLYRSSDLAIALINFVAFRPASSSTFTQPLGPLTGWRRSTR